MVRTIIYWGLCLCWVTSLSANNIQVTNVVSTGTNAPAGQTTISFDLSWENSWRVTTGASNWDAAWVFAKYRVDGGDWQHVRLSGQGQQPAGATVTVMESTGAMVHRSAPGTGSVNFTGLQLTWDITGAGVDPDAAIDILVFAIEMVYVPEGAFFVGDGRSDQNQFYAGGTAFDPYQITSEAAITVANTAGNLYYSNTDSDPGDFNGPIPATFPKGFAAFYCQKYETSQQEWVDFFNTLPLSVRPSFDLTQDAEYLAAGPNKANNRVTAYSTGNDISTTFPNIPVNYVNQVQALSYLDWAGLRPWTELEVEKAGRGTLTPVNGEYASGSNLTENVLPTVSNLGQTNSRVTNFSSGQGHFIFGIERNNESNGPLRCGITAASVPNANRLESGGSYYGIMDISGNLWERIVTVGQPAARTFQAVHGDGTLGSDGQANVSGWPAGSVEAFGIKGCAYVSGGGSNAARIIRCSVSARRNVAGNRNKGDHDYALFRGVRNP